MLSIRVTSRSASIERGLRAALLAVLLAAGGVLAGGGTAHAAGPVVRVAVMETTPPFSYRAPDGTLTGFNVEIMQALCRVMAATCTFEEVPFQNLLEAVATGRYEYGLANFLRTPEREARAAFSAPYWRSSSSFVGPANEADRAMPQAAAGRRVAVIRGSRQHAYMVQQGATPVEVTHRTEQWQAIRDGKADFALMSTLAALGLLMSDEGKAFSTIGTPLMNDGLGGTVHIVMPHGRPDLKRAVDDAIGAIRADGSYQEVNRRYFPFDVY
ncbi:substrate-binding periplasmic protein [Azospirillum sp. sgz301742]